VRKMYQQHHTRVDPRDPPRRKRTKGHVRHLTPTRRSMRNSHAMILTAAPSSRQRHEARRASFHWQGTKPRTAAFGWKDHDPHELARAIERRTCGNAHGVLRRVEVCAIPCVTSHCRAGAAHLSHSKARCACTRPYILKSDTSPNQANLYPRSRATRGLA